MHLDLLLKFSFAIIIFEILWGLFLFDETHAFPVTSDVPVHGSQQTQLRLVWCSRLSWVQVACLLWVLKHAGTLMCAACSTGVPPSRVSVFICVWMRHACEHAEASQP